MSLFVMGKRQVIKQQLFVLGIRMTCLIWMVHSFWLAVENWENDVLHAWLG